MTRQLAVSRRTWTGHRKPPAITLLFVAALAHPDFLLEIDATAVVPQKSV